jgi:hypothetical protein
MTIANIADILNSLHIAAVALERNDHTIVWEQLERIQKNAEALMQAWNDSQSESEDFYYEMLG